MGYVDRIIQPGESVITIGRMHWIIYARGILLLLVGAAAALAPLGPDLVWVQRGVALIVGIFGLYLLVASWIEQITTEIAVTNKRVIQKTGLIRRFTGEMNMDKVESVTVDQSILGRILGYGSIVVRGTGSGIEGLHHIADPLSLRSSIVVR